MDDLTATAMAEVAAVAEFDAAQVDQPTPDGLKPEPEPQTTTVACPPGFKHEFVVGDCPIWVDAQGVEYRIASGAALGFDTTDPKAGPDHVSIIVGVDGLTALTAMGLTRKADKE